MYDFRIRGKFKFGVNTIIIFAYIKLSRVSLLESRQNNVSNQEAHSEPCQTSKMECFAKYSPAKSC